MANTDRPNGFKASKTLSGAPVSSVMRKIAVADRGQNDTAGDLHIGDPISITEAGVVQLAATADLDVVGVIGGIGRSAGIDMGTAGMWNASDLETRYLPDDTAGFLWYYPVNDVLFEIQTGVVLALVVGEACDYGLGSTDLLITTESHGSSTTGQSLIEISSLNADAGALRVVEEVTTPDNDITLVHARFLVQFTKSRFGNVINEA